MKVGGTGKKYGQVQPSMGGVGQSQAATCDRKASEAGETPTGSDWVSRKFIRTKPLCIYIRANASRATGEVTAT